jgi:hypothetical protein
MGELPAAMPKKISAADHLLRSGCGHDARQRALDLLLAVAAVECHLSSGGPGAGLPALLRDVVIIVSRLAGPVWLKTSPESTASFSALRASLQPPPLPELDYILACVLLERFGLARATPVVGVEPIPARSA